jgi:hypothetical protein
VRHLVGAESLPILFRLQQVIHEPRQALLGDQNRESNPFLFTINRPAKNTTNDLIYHAIVAITAIKIVAEFLGEE